MFADGGEAGALEIGFGERFGDVVGDVTGAEGEEGEAGAAFKVAGDIGDEGGFLDEGAFDLRLKAMILGKSESFGYFPI